jgi:hypothetical protein
MSTEHNNFSETTLKVIELYLLYCHITVKGNVTSSQVLLCLLARSLEIPWGSHLSLFITLIYKYPGPQQSSSLYPCCLSWWQWHPVFSSPGTVTTFPNSRNVKNIVTYVNSAPWSFALHTAQPHSVSQGPDIISSHLFHPAKPPHPLIITLKSTSLQHY